MKTPEDFILHRLRQAQFKPEPLDELRAFAEALSVSVSWDEGVPDGRKALVCAKTETEMWKGKTDHG